MGDSWLQTMEKLLSKLFLKITWCRVSKGISIYSNYYYHYKVKAGGKFKQELLPGFNYFICVEWENLKLNGNTTVDKYQTAFSMKLVITLMVKILLPKKLKPMNQNLY